MTAGIRILDKEGNVVSLELKDVLNLVPDGAEFYWSILDIQVIGNLGPGMSVPVFEKEVVQSERGIFKTWPELAALSEKVSQTWDIVLVGCRERNRIHRYDKDKDMFDNCDIVIIMFDSSYWEIWSKNPNLIEAAERKFKDTKRISSDDPEFQPAQENQE